MPGVDGVDAWERRGAHHDVAGSRVFLVDRSPVEAADTHGVPVLVLHGFPTSSHDWHRVVDRFAGRQRVVLPDLVGFGLGDKPDRRYSLFDQADLVEAIARDLGLDEVALVTHDMGDSVGGEILAPMALPVLGGLLISDEVVDLFLPVRFYWVRRARWLKLHGKQEQHHEMAA